MIESTTYHKLITDTKEVRELKIINKSLQNKLNEREKRVSQLLSELRSARLKIRRLLNNEQNPVDMCDRAYAILCDMFVVDISRKSRERDYVKARQYYYRYLKDNSLLSLNKIADSLTIYSDKAHKQDHSTVIHALDEFSNFYITEKDYKKKYDDFCRLMEI